MTEKIKGPRKGVRLFRRSAGPNPAWESVPVQVDPIDEDGHLRFFPDTVWQGHEVHKSDLILFRSEDMGAKADPLRTPLPCRGTVIYELRNPQNTRFAYLTGCGFQATPQSHNDAVFIDNEAGYLDGHSYRYRFNKKNYMLFDEISFRSPGAGWRTVARSSEMLIRADVRNFFSMSFDSDEIESQMEASRLGPVGNLARLSFYLRILFFKIRMSLSTDVAFFSDSGHIPMMINVPVNSHDYLHPKSGILYSWELSQDMQALPAEVRMPMLNPDSVAKGWESHAAGGLSWCSPNDCRFNYAVDVQGQRLAMEFGIAKKLVRRGFYPLFVADVAHFKEKMGWDLQLKPGTKRIGLYFEVSGLPKGGHPWDFWLRLGNPAEIGGSCPAPLRMTLIR